MLRLWIGKKKEGGQGARANRRGFGSPEEKKKEENNIIACVIHTCVSFAMHLLKVHHTMLVSMVRVSVPLGV